MKILALDLVKFNSVCCFFNTQTRKAKFLTTPTKREHIATVFKDCKADLVVMESCGPSGWINGLAQSFGLATFVCSTNVEAWRWVNVKCKTDKDDALKLACMAAMRELEGVHIPSPEHREFRSLVKYSKTLDGRINKTKNAIRAWFTLRPRVVPEGSPSTLNQDRSCQWVAAFGDASVAVGFTRFDTAAAVRNRRRPGDHSQSEPDRRCRRRGSLRRGVPRREWSSVA